jgi:multiple sugar transport system permease protein
MERKHNDERFAELRAIWHIDAWEFRDTLGLFQYPDVERPGTDRRIKDWQDFKEEAPFPFVVVLYRNAWIGGRTQLEFQDFLRDRYKDDIKACNRELGLHVENFGSIAPPVLPKDGHTLRIAPHEQALEEAWREFVETLPPSDLDLFAADGFYQRYILSEFATVEAYNMVAETNYKSFLDVKFPVRPPENPELREVYEAYIRKKWPVRFIHLGEGDEERAEVARLYREFLRKRYKTTDRYNNVHQSGIASFDEADVFYREPPGDTDFAVWLDFVNTIVPLNLIYPEDAGTMFKEFLKKRYDGDIASLNGAYHASFLSFDEVPIPRRLEDYADFLTRKASIRWGFITENYGVVLRYILVQGRAFFNTVILVVATVLGQLTVMPMAAFALSRFRLPYAHRILLFLLATMAFPGEVAMIPNFLLLKEFHLLNTYWALVLPGLANGFGIFLLKGFFDSLPRELYEAATIEGASEMRMFWQITLPLSKPILAVIALGAFTAAYGGFMWAYLICQKKSMWTLMVFLYDFQAMANPPFQVMAALVLAAIPTLLVFIFCQKIIMRGIIIPTFK